MKVVRTILIFTFIILFSSPVMAHSLKIATWNIEHLRDSNNEGPNKRKQEDYDRIAKYITELNADIVALQEVEGPNAAKRIFDPAEYNFFFSRRNDVLLTGFAVRKSLNVVWNPDFTDLNVNGGLRNGTDITVTFNGESIRLLSVHLKSGCWDDSITSNKDACKTLFNQLAELEEWIDARAAEQIPFIVLGDFNRRMDIQNDDFWPEIDDGMPANADLSRATEGKTSDCWGAQFPLYIDHIVLDRVSSKWLVSGSFSQLIFIEGESLKEKLSDHCPISIIIDPALTGIDLKTQKALNKIDQIENDLKELRMLIKEINPE